MTQASKRSLVNCDRCGEVIIIKAHGSRLCRPCSYYVRTKLLADRHRARLTSLIADAKPDECVDWPGYVDKNGYGETHLDGKKMFAHRAAYVIANGPIADGAWVLHGCDRPRCINPHHLRLGTPAENTADMMRRGRHRSSFPGTKHVQAKLTEEAALAIKFSAGPRRLIAAKYGVSPRTVRSIQMGEKWKHLPDEMPTAAEMLAEAERLGRAA